MSDEVLEAMSSEVAKRYDVSIHYGDKPLTELALIQDICDWILSESNLCEGTYDNLQELEEREDAEGPFRHGFLNVPDFRCLFDYAIERDDDWCRAVIEHADFFHAYIFALMYEQFSREEYMRRFEEDPEFRSRIIERVKGVV